jgi:hypothetical protein
LPSYPRLPVERSLYAKQFSLRHLLIALTLTCIALVFFDYGGLPRMLLGVTLSLLCLTAGAAVIAWLRPVPATIVVATTYLGGMLTAVVGTLDAGFRRRFSDAFSIDDQAYLLVIAWYAAILLFSMGCGWLMSVVRERG